MGIEWSMKSIDHIIESSFYEDTVIMNSILYSDHLLHSIHMLIVVIFIYRGGNFSTSSICKRISNDMI